MISIRLAFFFLIITGVAKAQDYPNDKVQDYIVRFRYLAVKNMVDYKIPASIIMGQALLESGYGSSPLAVKANNHFGIKCKPEWRGKTYHHNDDRPQECFRSYPTAEDSFNDHAIFLASRIFYKSLFKLNPSDYKAWAKGLKRAGYATNPRYAVCLINIIERYGLHKLDKVGIQLIVFKEKKKEQALELLALHQFDVKNPIEKVSYRPYELLSFNRAIDFNCTTQLKQDATSIDVSSHNCIDIAISIAYLRDEEE